MVTAILPALTYEAKKSDSELPNGSQARTSTCAPSISSQRTITPASFASTSTGVEHDSLNDNEGYSSQKKQASTSQLAGLVGTFTGFGALIALGVFLPLPALFQKAGVTPVQAVADAFWIVGAIALLVAVLCFIGLTGLPGEDLKGLYRVWRWRDEERKANDEAIISGIGSANTNTATTTTTTTVLSYPALLYAAIRLGISDSNIGLAYIGGLVARASSVGISLFIPLFVDKYFIATGRCKPGDVDLKHDCRQAYLLAAALTGVSQFMALLCAPVFGWLGSQPQYRNNNLPLLLAAAAGVAGNAAFSRLKSPDFHEKGNGGVWAIVILIGISQIGAIVCSLALLGRGVQSTPLGPKGIQNGDADSHSTLLAPVENRASVDEAAPLLEHTDAPRAEDSRAHLKGSIAGVYSLSGGAGILILTKLGGWAADKDAGAPFIILAIFNGLLLIAGLGVWITKSFLRRTNNSTQ